MRSIACALVAFLSLVLPAIAPAQALPGGAQLGMTAQELQQAVPALERIARPVHLSGGLSGNWRGPAVAIAGVALVPTFYFAQAQLSRVEYVAAADPRAFDALVAWGRSSWGQELASLEQEGRYAAWNAPQVDAYLQQTSAMPAQLRLVIKRPVAKDASEL